MGKTYIAWDGKFSDIIDTIDSSAVWSAIVTGPAARAQQTSNQSTKSLTM